MSTENDQTQSVDPQKVQNVVQGTGGYPVGKRQLLDVLSVLTLPSGLPHGDLDDEFQAVVMREAADRLDMDTVRTIVLTCSNIAKNRYKCPWCNVPTGLAHTLQLHITAVHQRGLKDERDAGMRKPCPEHQDTEALGDTRADSRKCRDDLIGLIDQYVEAERLRARIDERQFAWNLINDIRYERTSLTSARDNTLERLSASQVKQQMELEAQAGGGEGKA